MLKWFPYNMHFIERAIRSCVGLVMLSYIAWGPATSFAAAIDHRWALLGLYPFITGFAGWDPFYALFGLNFRTKKLTLTEWDLPRFPRDAQARERLEQLGETPARL
jgi:hypothetical protein